ncbi:putative response regulator and transcription factor RR-A-type family [Dioscorea sansibarensis]
MYEILHGYEVTSCKSSTEALSTLQGNSVVPDLVLAEVHLSGVSGLELISRVKFDFKLLVMSMCFDGNPVIMSQALSQGASFHLTKPLTDAGLETIWQHVWKKKAKVMNVRAKINRLPAKRKNNNSDNNVGANLEKQTGQKKNRMLWDSDLHQRFLVAVTLLGDNCVPRRILDLMNVDGLNVKHVGSHLQKHRKRVQKAVLVDGIPELPTPVTGRIPTALFMRRTAAPRQPFYRTQNLDIIPNVAAVTENNGSSSEPLPSIEAAQRNLVQKMLYDQLKQAHDFGIGRRKSSCPPSNSGVVPLQSDAQTDAIYQQNVFPINQVYQQNVCFPNDGNSTQLNWEPSLNPSLQNNYSTSLQNQNYSDNISFLNHTDEMQNVYGSTIGIGSYQVPHNLPKEPFPPQAQALNITEDGDILQTLLDLPEFGQNNIFAGESSQRVNSPLGESANPDAMYQNEEVDFALNNQSSIEGALGVDSLMQAYVSDPPANVNLVQQRTAGNINQMIGASLSAENVIDDCVSGFDPRVREDLLEILNDL